VGANRGDDVFVRAELPERDRGAYALRGRGAGAVERSETSLLRASEGTVILRFGRRLITFLSDLVISFAPNKE